MSKNTSKIIRTVDDLLAGVEVVTTHCEQLAEAHARAGAPSLRLREGGAMGLLRIVVGQQLSVASAAAIWGRFEQAVVCEAEVIDIVYRMTDEDLKGRGLSRPKIRTIRAVCEAVRKGQLDFDRLGEGSIEEVHEALTPIHGIGPWTADIYAMFCLGHADAWAPGDLALQYAVQDVFSLAERPDGKTMERYGERWKPWRGVAARILWAYYSAMKENRTGIPV